jgi:hypothetical protein
MHGHILGLVRLFPLIRITSRSSPTMCFERGYFILLSPPAVIYEVDAPPFWSPRDPDPFQFGLHLGDHVLQLPGDPTPADEARIEESGARRARHDAEEGEEPVEGSEGFKRRRDGEPQRGEDAGGKELELEFRRPHRGALGGVEGAQCGREEVGPERVR